MHNAEHRPMPDIGNHDVPKTKKKRKTKVEEVPAPSSPQEIRDYIRSLCPDAIDLVYETMTHELVPIRLRFECAKEILSFALPKPQDAPGQNMSADLFVKLMGKPDDGSARMGKD